MKDYIRLGFVLFIFAAIGAGVLAYINGITDPIIKENQLKEEMAARVEVLPGAEKFEPASIAVEAKKAAPNPLKIQEKGSGNSFDYFKALDKDGKILGYVFVASLYGYSSDVKSMVGVVIEDGNLVVNKIKILSQAETPGLGANCTFASFKDQFKKLALNDCAVKKDGGKIQSITGATITSRTVANSIKVAMQHLQTAIAKEQE